MPVQIDAPYTVFRGGTGLHDGSHIEIVDAIGRKLIRFMRMEGETKEDSFDRATAVCNLLNANSNILHPGE